MSWGDGFIAKGCRYVQYHRETWAVNVPTDHSLEILLPRHWCPGMPLPSSFCSFPSSICSFPWLPHAYSVLTPIHHPVNSFCLPQGSFSLVYGFLIALVWRKPHLSMKQKTIQSSRKFKALREDLLPLWWICKNCGAFPVLFSILQWRTQKGAGFYSCQHYGSKTNQKHRPVKGWEIFTTYKAYLP